MHDRTQSLAADLGPMVECEEMVTDHGSPGYQQWANSAHLTHPPISRSAIIRNDSKGKVDEEGPTTKLPELPCEGRKADLAAKAASRTTRRAPAESSRIATPIALRNRNVPAARQSRHWLVVIFAPLVGAALGYIFWLGLYAR